MIASVCIWLNSKRESPGWDVVPEVLTGRCRALQGIISAMQDLRKQSRVQRILRKQYNDAALSEHKDKLKNALTAFQVRCYSAASLTTRDRRC